MKDHISAHERLSNPLTLKVKETVFFYISLFFIVYLIAITI